MAIFDGQKIVEMGLFLHDEPKDDGSGEKFGFCQRHIYVKCKFEDGSFAYFTPASDEHSKLFARLE